MTTKKATTVAKKMISPFESNPFKVVFSNFSGTFKFNAPTMIFFIVGALVFYILYFVFSIIVSIATGDINTSSTNSPLIDSNESESTIVGAILAIVFFVIVYLVMIFLYGMANYAAYTTQLKKKTSLGEVFNATLAKFGTIFRVSFLYLLVQFIYISAGVLGTIAIGTLTSYWLGSIVAIFFGVLSIRFALIYTYATYPIFANNMKAIESYKHVRKITKGHLIEILTHYVINNLVAQFTLNVLTLPIYASTISFMYPQMEAASRANQKTKVHWANWLVTVGVGLLMAALIGLVVLILILANEEARTGDYNNNFEYDYSNDYDIDY